MKKPFDEYERQFGEAVRQARIRKGVTLEEAALRANVSPTSVRALELGRGSTLSTLMKVLLAIGETDIIDEFISSGTMFSPLEALRESRGERTPRRRVSKRRK